MLNRVKSTILLVVPGLVLSGLPTTGACQKADERTGFYLVLAQAPSAEGLPAPTAGRKIVRYDYKYVLQEDRVPTQYLLLSSRPDVALLLGKPPEKMKGEGGRTQLLIELTREAARDLEKLSRENLGKRVAFVIDGEIVSVHKIRSVIADGKFRLSRCTDNACEYIYGQLTKR